MRADFHVTMLGPPTICTSRLIRFFHNGSLDKLFNTIQSRWREGCTYTT